MQPENVKLGLRLAQSKPLYEAFKALKAGPQWSKLSATQQRIVDNELRDFVLGGVALEGEAKERCAACRDAIVLAAWTSHWTEGLQQRIQLTKDLPESQLCHYIWAYTSKPHYAI